MSDPPGTKWLKETRSNRNIKHIAAEKGSWQFAIRPAEGGDMWHVMKSPPSSNEWEFHSGHRTLNSAIQSLGRLQTDTRE